MDLLRSSAQIRGDDLSTGGSHISSQRYTPEFKDLAIRRCNEPECAGWYFVLDCCLGAEVRLGIRCRRVFVHHGQLASAIHTERFECDNRRSAVLRKPIHHAKITPGSRGIPHGRRG